MHRLSAALIAAVSAVAFTQIAAAADLPRKAPAAPPPPPAISWSGFYIGANIGGGWSNRDINYSANDPPAFERITDPFSGSLPTSFNSAGVIGGIQLGYNWQFNRNWLVGLETDFDWSGMKGSLSHTNIAPFTNRITTNLNEHIRWFGTVRGRFGYLPADNLLVYATGGFAYAQVERTGSYVNDDPGNFIAASFGGFSYACAQGPGVTCFAGSSKDVATGWTVGGGLEYAILQRWTVRAEYLYVSLGTTSVTETALVLFAGGSSPSSFNANFRTNFNVARAGVNYRF
jgi:outer membrane immunogenic protein